MVKLDDWIVSRFSGITLLDAVGATVKEAMPLARHSTLDQGCFLGMGSVLDLTLSALGLLSGVGTKCIRFFTPCFFGVAFRGTCALRTHLLSRTALRASEAVDTEGSLPD